MIFLANMIGQAISAEVSDCGVVDRSKITDTGMRWWVAWNQGAVVRDLNRSCVDYSNSWPQSFLKFEARTSKLASRKWQALSCLFSFSLVSTWEDVLWEEHLWELDFIVELRSCITGCICSCEGTNRNTLFVLDGLRRDSWLERLRHDCTQNLLYGLVIRSGWKV